MVYIRKLLDKQNSYYKTLYKEYPEHCFIPVVTKKFVFYEIMLKSKLWLLFLNESKMKTPKILLEKGGVEERCFTEIKNK